MGDRMAIYQDSDMSDEEDSGTQELGIDRRRYERFDVSISVDYANGDTFLFSYIQNISEMGIFIRSDEPLPVGTALQMRFTPEGQEPIEVTGEVTWVNPYRPFGDNLNPGMGVHFRNLTSELRERVVSLVRTVAYLRPHSDN
jgi:type IV pilus assembly protein PilZ